MSCLVCTGPCRERFRHAVLRKHEASYFQCDTCGFLQTQEPHWLEEAYSSAIAPADTGILARNTYLSNVTAALLFRMFGTSGTFLDAAGGYGILTRLMRDIGFDYYWHDPHAQNLLARGFEAKLGDRRYDAVTAFEVLEHLHDPVGFLEELLQTTGARTYLVSTELFSGEAPQPAQWPYYEFDTGQHISFYRESTLARIASRLGLRLYSNGIVHMWTDRDLSRWQFKMATTPRFAQLWAARVRRRLTSRIWADHDRLLGKR